MVIWMQHPKHGRHPAHGGEVEMLKANGWEFCLPKNNNKLLEKTESVINTPKKRQKRAPIETKV